jgi:type I restriction enzyme, S subunit
MPEASIARQTLQGVCAKPITYGVVQTGPHLPNGVPCVRVVDLTKPRLSVESMVRTSEEINRAYRRTILEPNEILFALRGEIGHVKLVPKELVGANVTRGIARISPDQRIVHPRFLFHALQSPQARIALLKSTNGSALQEIPIAALRKLRIDVPPLNEQRHVAEVLDCWATAIDQIERLLKLKRRLKHGLMQQLLTGRRRFPEFIGEAWRQTSLDSFFKESRIPGTNGAVAKKLTIKLYCKGVVAKRDDSIGSTATRYYRRKAGQFVYSKLDFLNGAFGIVPEALDDWESTLDLPAFDISPTVDRRWVLYRVGSEDFYRRQLGAANGGRKARRVNPHFCD